MDSSTGRRAVLVDALGTLVRLEPPAPRLCEELRRLAGVEVAPTDAERAFQAEIAYYLEHHLEGRDPESLAGLRERSARVLGRELGMDLEPALVLEALLGSLSFTAFPDAAPALRDLRASGLRLVVVSNWDCSLPQVLADASLAELVDGVVSSAVVGSAKPDPAPFRAALELAGSEPGDALHVGDSPSNDVEGARAAAIEPVLLARAGEAAPGVRAIRSLAELPAIARRLP